jgi:S-adenosylmethionine-diacylglycerol 3-amino-3-carboxypropyl transferase
MKSGILYGMCWEDPDLFTALVKPNDEVLTVCSAGDIAMSTLTKNPSRVVAVDTNSDQIELTKTKAWAFQHLNYHDCHRFIGTFGPSPNRVTWLEPHYSSMSLELKSWIVSNHLDQKSILQSGRFETYLRFFARFLLPLAVSKKTIHSFLNAQSLEEQLEIYNHRIDNMRYRFLFRQFFGRLQRIGRHPDLLKHVKADLAGVFYQRIKHAWLDVSIENNYFFRFILTGLMQQNLTLPLWAQIGNFESIKKSAGTLEFVNNSIVDFLENTKDSFDAINLSNISEVMTVEDSNRLFELCRTHLKPNGHLLVWNNMVDRKPNKNWKLDESRTLQFWENRTGSLYGFLGVYQPA